MLRTVLFFQIHYKPIQKKYTQFNSFGTLLLRADVQLVVWSACLASTLQWLKLFTKQIRPMCRNSKTPLVGAGV